MTGSSPNGADINSLYPKLPPAIELDPEQRKRVLAGVRVMLSRLHEAGVVRADDFAAMIGNPQLLAEFLAAAKKRLDLVSDLIVDRAGAPVTSEDKELSCGLSAAQIRQMLIFTCAKRVFAEADGKTEQPQRRAPPPPPPPKSGFSLFKRDTTPQPARQAITEGERKLNEIRPLLAFDWQLPLLKFYYFYFNQFQLGELGRDLLLLRDRAKIEAVAGCDVSLIRRARQVLRDEFPLMLRAQPGAIRLVAEQDPDKLPLFREAMGDRVWDFYARPIEYFDLVSELQRERIEAFGPMLADMSPEAIKAFDPISWDRVGLLIKGLTKVLGPAFTTLLGNPAFCAKSLPQIVQPFARVEGKPEEFMELVYLKGTALQPAFNAWIERMKANQAAAQQKASA